MRPSLLNLELVHIEKTSYNRDMKNIEYKTTNYPSDLTDAQWKKIAEHFPMGNKGTIHKRSLVEAVLYLVDNGCK